MKFTIIYIFSLCLSTSLAVGQSPVRLATITVDSPNNSSGLGSYFTGKVMSDGDLYFRGSPDGLYLAIWKTDGTIAGTSKIIQETTDFQTNWDQVFYLGSGVLISHNNENWSILRPGSTTLTSLDNIPKERIENIQELADGSYYFTTNRNDTHILHQVDADFSTVKEIGDFHPDQTFVTLFSGSAGACIFNTNAFQDDKPSVYLKASNKILPIEDYGSNLGLDINDHTYSYIQDKFMFLSYKDSNNFFQNKIVDMESSTVADFNFIREPLAYYTRNGKHIIVTKKEVISIDKSNLSSTLIFDEVFAFTPLHVNDDKLYLISGDEEVVEIDLLAESFKTLENSSTGVYFYNSNMETFENNFFYITEDDFQYLRRYDFDNNTNEIIDTLSINTGATVVHALVEVNNNLVMSKRIGFLQHELYVLDFTSNVNDIQFTDVKAYPTLTTDLITVELNDKQLNRTNEVLIFTATGGIVDAQLLDHNRMRVDQLPSGSYFAIIKGEEEQLRFRFVKQ